MTYLAPRLTQVPAPAGCDSEAEGGEGEGASRMALALIACAHRSATNASKRSHSARRRTATAPLARSVAPPLHFTSCSAFVPRQPRRECKATVYGRCRCKLTRCYSGVLQEMAFCEPLRPGPSPVASMCMVHLQRVCGEDRMNISKCDRCVEAAVKSAPHEFNCTERQEREFCEIHPAPSFGCERQLLEQCGALRHDQDKCDMCVKTHEDKDNCTKREGALEPDRCVALARGRRPSTELVRELTLCFAVCTCGVGVELTFCNSTHPPSPGPISDKCEAALAHKCAPARKEGQRECDACVKTVGATEHCTVREGKQPREPGSCIFPPRSPVGHAERSAMSQSYPTAMHPSRSMIAVRKCSRSRAKTLKRKGPKSATNALRRCTPRSLISRALAVTSSPIVAPLLNLGPLKTNVTRC